MTNYRNVYLPIARFTEPEYYLLHDYSTNSNKAQLKICSIFLYMFHEGTFLEKYTFLDTRGIQSLVQARNSAYGTAGTATIGNNPRQAFSSSLPLSPAFGNGRQRQHGFLERSNPVEKRLPTNSRANRH